LPSDEDHGDPQHRGNETDDPHAIGGGLRRFIHGAAHPVGKRREYDSFDCEGEPQRRDEIRNQLNELLAGSERIRS
jgi:hypothetical protein